MESMGMPSPAGKSPARSRRRLSKGGIEKENADPKSPLSILKKGEQRRALGDLHVFDVRSPARTEMVNGQSIEASPVFNKKRSKRSLNRRVSFAEQPAVRIFVKDIEYETPPDAKTQKAGSFTNAAPAQTALDVEAKPASTEQPQPAALELNPGRPAEIYDSNLQFEMLPAGNTGPISWSQGREASIGVDTEPLALNARTEEMDGQQSTPVMQQPQAAGGYHGTPVGTPGGNESSPEFFSPRNYVSPLSSDDGMELTHTPTADFELLPPQNEAFGSAISYRRRSSLGGGARPSFGGFDAAERSPLEKEPVEDVANFTDMTGSITAMVPKLAKILAEQQDFTFSTGPVIPARREEWGNEEGVQPADVSPVHSDMSLTPIANGLPSQQTGEPAPAAEELMGAVLAEDGGRGVEVKPARRRFGDLLSEEEGGEAGAELPVFRDESPVDNRRGSITGAIPHLQDLLAADLGGDVEATEGVNIWASGERRGSITGAIPNLQALLEADQDAGSKESTLDWAAKAEVAQQGGEDGSTGDLFNFETAENEIGSPEEGETTQLLNFGALMKRVGMEIAAGGDDVIENVTDLVPRLADLVDADGAEPQAESAPNGESLKTEEEKAETREEPKAAPAPAAGIVNASLPLLFTGDEQEEVFGVRPRFNAGSRPSHGRASLQPLGTGSFRPAHRRGSVRGRASVGGWAAMLSAEAQEGGAVDRWWVKDKPEAEQDETNPSVQESSAAIGNKVEAANLPGDDAKATEVRPPAAIETVHPNPVVQAVEPSLVLALPAALPAQSIPAPSPKPVQEVAPSKKRPREEAGSDLQQAPAGEQSEASLQTESSPKPAVKRQRRLQVLTPVTEQMSGAEREESQGTVFGRGDQTAAQEVTQDHGETAKETVTGMDETVENQTQGEEYHVVSQDEIPTQHSGVIGSQGAFETEKELSELEYKMLRLQNNRATPAKTPSPNALPISSRLQLRRSTLKMQTALAAAAQPPLAAEQNPEQQAESTERQPSVENVPASVTEQSLEIVASAPEPPVEKPAEPIPTATAEPPAGILPTDPAEPPVKEQAELPPVPELAVEGPVDIEEDVTETTLPLPPARLQGLMHLRRESLGVLPPTQGPVRQGLPPAGPVKPFTPAAQRAFTPRGKEKFTPILGLSSVRKFRTPAPDKAAPVAAPHSVRPARNEDTTAELDGEEEGTGKIAGRISFAEFLYKVEIRFFDNRNRASMFGQQTPTADLAPPEGLADCLKVVCFNQPQTTILDFGCGELRESIAAKKASVAHFEAKLQDMCPAIFHAVQTAAGPERAALLKKLKDLKQRCRLEARRQWLEWRLRLEENTSERLQENERNLMEDLAAVQQKRQQLHALRQDVRNFQAEIEANIQRAEDELQAAREREEETRGIKVRLAEEVRRQQAEMEEREQQAREAERYRESMAAQRESAEAEHQRLLERLRLLDASCAEARAALISSGAAGDDGRGGGRIAVDESQLEKLRQKGDSRKEDLAQELDIVVATQGWVLSRQGWQAAASSPEESAFAVDCPNLETAAGAVDLSDKAASSGAAKRRGPSPGDAVQGQESGAVAEAAGVAEASEKEAVLELRYHDGLFSQAFYRTGKNEFPEESRLQLDRPAIDGRFGRIGCASGFAAAMLTPVGERVKNSEGRTIGSLVQKASLRIGRVFDLLEELNDCCSDFEELSSAAYSETEGPGILQLRFTDHQAVMLTLALSLSQTDCTTYPFGSLPFKSTVQYADPDTKRNDLEKVVTKAVSAISPGFGRMKRACEIVAELIRGSRYPE
ncbi:hypothetical protein KFL_000280380 [Klebsormidium nitens]|uniref:Spc7 kinetochore protein domain-containing protein n=1 Tax=Klebsormidium nitens TaxID=105231 RepID=A0A1Y1HMV0_KLENI|nr:hypothetical protein KFL_000280380 [Klebsormidium nitens]|eukprot:GAQ79333.1 hypothetical protein KFL_000280380 [Klebsormidium nitens]